RLMANVVNAARSYRPVHGGYATPMEPTRGGLLDGLQRDVMMPPRGGPSGAMGSCYNFRRDEVPMVGRSGLPCKRARDEEKTVEVQSIGESTSKVMRTDPPDDVQFYCVDVDRLAGIGIYSYVRAVGATLRVGSAHAPLHEIPNRLAFGPTNDVMEEARSNFSAVSAFRVHQRGGYQRSVARGCGSACMKQEITQGVF
ncbi:hypothetical protein FOZ62_028475, partial [Perkinsus olseni]